jgi:hypothetical protein
VQDRQDQVALERGVFGMAKPQGWTIEWIVNLMAGAVVLTTQPVRCERSSRLRVLTRFVSANLPLDAVVDSSAMSVQLHRLGVSTAPSVHLAVMGELISEAVSAPARDR